MKNIITTILLCSYLIATSQEKYEGKKVKISGKIIEKTTSQPLEYATITLINSTTKKQTTGGVTNPKGDFDVTTNTGIYDIKIEFISFKPTIIKQKNIQENTNLGTIILEDDASQLNEVVVRAEKTTVEIKLDKKVFNVGKDLMVRGGTVSDVLDNIPSVSVDADGVVSLRGNENVKILIDGKPSNSNNIAEALKSIPADAIDKVEVVTNPSARYDAEGGAGLLNIILKKGKNLGLNGVFITSLSHPESEGISGTLNYKSKKFNLFTTQGYNNRNLPGGGFVKTNYLNPNPDSPSYVLDSRETDRLNKSYNGNFGFEWLLSDKTSWTNTLNYRKNNGKNQDNVLFDNQFTDIAKNYISDRTSNEITKSENVEFLSSFIKNFKKEGHKLTIDFQTSKNDDTNTAIIIDTKTGNDNTENIQNQNKNLLQTDYVLPLNKKGQFEAGYRGEFSKQLTDVVVYTNNVLNTNYSNLFQYNENVNAVYSQFGSKINKISYLFGIRWEDSNIDVNQITSNIYKNKKYNNFFPSAFLTYELSDNSSLSLNYSRRISRPRGRQINPFSNYSSNINIFLGNPDLNPAMTDAVDFGYLKKWTKLTLNTSMYVNQTTDVFQFVRKESGTFVNDIPVIITTFVNLATEKRVGFEFTLNYSPYKWWRLNSNFNFFNIDTKGNYSYTDFKNQIVTQNFDKNTSSWFTRLSSKVTLPSKIDWQTNLTYNGSQNTAQGKFLGVFAASIAFSKDVLKDKGTISLSSNDIFNSRKRKVATNIPNLIDSYLQFQPHGRMFTLSFTYRFNKQKTEKEKPQKKMPQEENGGGDF